MRHTLGTTKASLPLTLALSAVLVMLAASVHSAPPRVDLARIASNRTLPAFARSAKKELDLIAQHYQRGNTTAGDAAWKKLATRLFNGGNRQHAPSVINYVVYQAHVASRPKLARSVDRMLFFRSLRQAAAQQRTRLAATLRTARKGQTLTVKITPLNTRFRPGLTSPTGAERAEQMSKEEIERKRAEMEQTMADAAAEEAKENAEQARDLWKSAIKVLIDTQTRMQECIKAISQ